MSPIVYFLKDRLPIIVGALLLAFIIGVQTPIEIYINNASEFTTPINSIYAILSVAFVALFLVFFMPALVPFKNFRRCYFALLATLGVLIWFNSNFMFGNYGAFDGHELSINANSILAIGQIIVSVMLLLLALIFNKRVEKLLMQLVSGVLLVVLVSMIFYGSKYFFFSENKTISQVSDPETYFHNDFLTFSSEKNIIHILLDEQQSSLTETYFMENPSMKEAFSGFIFFPNAASNYPKTNMALGTLFRGTTYKNDMPSLSKFYMQGLNASSLYSALETAGYQINIHTTPDLCSESERINCIPIPNPTPRSSAYLLLDYSLFKTVPDMLKPKIYRNGEWWISNRFVSPNYYATTSGTGHKIFEYFNQNIKVDDIQPTYKFFHSLISHAPFVLDENCNLLFKTQSRRNLSSRLNITECTFSHVVTLLNKLKELGVYDNSLIIISSDHGSPLSLGGEHYSLEESIISKYYSHALITLLIKPINAKGEMFTSLKPVMLSDIPNTILETEHLPLAPEGRNIFTLSENDSQPREFVYYDLYTQDWESPYLTGITFTINGDVRKLENWSINCSDLKEAEDIAKKCH